ncbi:thiol-disulfide oxidoreductase DCC family protein [Rothia nasimurium]|uniref:thiol-disulfide oxidoreductase DCC family protein n=1 Tax=Rothia nasimurium TaxID=85336 RepID=UPI003B9DC9CB
MTTSVPAEGLLLYDPDCGICQKAARLLTHLGLEAQVRPGHYDRLEEHGVNFERFMRQIPFITPTGQVAYGALAIALALATSRYAPVRVAASALKNPQLRPLAERIYLRISTNRSTACQLKP